MKPQFWLKRLASVSVVLGALSLGAIAVNLSFFALLYPKVVAFEPLPVWTDRIMNAVVGPAFLVMALFHVVALATLALQLRTLRRVSLVPPLLCALGVISLLLVAGNFPLLGDIGKEYKAGLETDHEWFFVFANHGVHALFAIVAVWNISYTNRIMATGLTPEPAARDEAVFLSAHTVGIFSGLLGLIMIASLVAFDFPVRFLGRAVGVFGMIIIAPYAIAAGSWLFLKRSQAPRDWLDEKQSTDVGRAALTTLLVVFPLLWTGYAFQAPALPAAVIRDLWFPVAAYLALSVFSISTVWFSRS